jgi:protein kinase
MKPENLLEINGTIKLADLGLAREIRAKPPFTEYVSTRWYRAPEALLRGRNYNSPMDLFAVGAIMAELYTGMPLFPGSTERDQLVRILQLMGTPSKEEWPEGYRLAAQLSVEIPVFEPASLAKAIPEAPPEALNLISGLLQVPPQRRLTAQQALQHEYFKVKTKEKTEVWQPEESGAKEEESWARQARYRVGKKCKL